jgi:hypothetical protein
MLPRAGGGGAAPVPPAAGERPVDAILLLSDGAQRGGILTPLQGAARARSYRIPVYTVALGAPASADQGGGGLGGPGGGGGPGTGGAPGPGGGPFGFNMAPDPATLRAIARATRGESFATGDADRLRAVYEDLASRIGRRPGWRQVGDILLAVAAALTLAGVATSLRWVHRLP